MIMVIFVERLPDRGQVHFDRRGRCKAKSYVAVRAVSKEAGLRLTLQTATSKRTVSRQQALTSPRQEHLSIHEKQTVLLFRKTAAAVFLQIVFTP